jgi:hypothetical protein
MTKGYPNEKLRYKDCGCWGIYCGMVYTYSDPPWVGYEFVSTVKG